MKTAIITFHAPTNYGAFLQAYALQTYLTDKLKIDTDVINYQTKKQKQLCSLFLPWNSISNFVKNGITLFHFHSLRQREREFHDMQRTLLHLTKPLVSFSDVKSIYNHYDLLISGSDQIWNGEIRGFLKGGQEPYFLKDCTRPKISYATSLGPKDTSMVRATIEKYRDSIQAYQAISVRETCAQSILHDYTDQVVETVVDPIFLLDQGDYKALFDHSHTPKQDYILLYTVNYDDELLKKVAKASKELQLPVIVPFSNHKSIKCKKYGFKIVYNIGPGCFLDLLYHATLVITNSFHGTAFSIHFHKDFFCYRAKKQGIMVADDRLDTLLTTAGLKDRIIFLDSDSTAFRQPMTEVQAGLKLKIEESRKWLQSAIGMR